MLIASSIQLCGAFVTLCYIYDKTKNQNYYLNTFACLKGVMFLNNTTDYIFNEHNGWELFIEFEKWCNILYVTDLMDKTMCSKGRVFGSHIIWMYLCKPLYCLIYSIFLIMQTIEIVMWIWIPFIILLWFLSLHTFLKISSGYTLFCCLAIAAISYCSAVYFHRVIMESITFDTAIELTMFVNSGIVGGVAVVAIICLKYKSIRGIKRYFMINWIFISAIFTLTYIIELTINSWNRSKYQYSIWLSIWRLFGMYCWFLSFNLGIFICGNILKYKNFNQKRFMLSCYLFSWMDLHCIHSIFHKP